jgi:tetratricopeptide (TPR) repeat protein
MDQTLEIIRRGCLVVSLTLLAGVVLIRWFQRTSDDRGWLTTKLIISLFAFWIFVNGLSAGPFFFFSALTAGGILAALWTGNICRTIAKPIGDLYDGGDEEIEPQPFYSVARGLRARGNYAQAVAEIEKQLANFPGDFDGQLLLAEIQVTDLKDIKATEDTVQAICDVPKQTPQHIAAALNTLADWHLKFAKDHQAARRDLERIGELCPNSEAALGAAQRIAHLGAEEKPWSLHERKKHVVPEGIKNYGLMAHPPRIAPEEVSPEKLAADYTAHLERHPLDMEAREKLAVIYADHYQRLDLATEQLEQMIEQPQQPARSVAHWLNRLADLQIRCGNDYAAAKLTLQRIVDRFPNLAAADLARNRIELLRLEFRSKEKSQVRKLGSYEQNIGLKYGSPRKL